MNGNASARPAPASATDPPAWDDKDGHYIITPGRCLGANDKCKLELLNLVPDVANLPIYRQDSTVARSRNIR
jgi:hypothetical protein